MSISYLTAKDERKYLEVMVCYDVVCFGSTDDDDRDEAVKNDEVPTISWIELDRDSVAALVGQLTSWLEWQRTRNAGE